MGYRLIATDMDGTLLDSNGLIPEKNFEVLKRAEEKGIIVVLSTGRPYMSANYHAQKLGLKSPIISSNGAVVHDIDRNIVYERTLLDDVIIKVLDILEQEDIYYHLYTINGVYSKTINKEIFTKYYGDENGNLVIETFKFNNYKDILFKGKKFNKIITITNDNNKLKNLRARLSEINEIEVTSSLKDNVEIMSKQVSKKNALEYLCSELEIKSDEILAIGDNGNDLDMLLYAGCSIAMGNAIDIVKEKADYITDTNDNDGWAKAIEKFIL